MNKVLIPSETLEPIVTKTIADMWSWFGNDPKMTWYDLDKMMCGLGMFIQNTNAIHCILAYNNARGMLLKYENKPEQLRALFKKTELQYYENQQHETNNTDTISPDV